LAQVKTRKEWLAYPSHVWLDPIKVNLLWKKLGQFTRY